VLVVLKLDRDMKILLIIDLYLLLSIVSTGIVYFAFQDFIDVQSSVLIGLILGSVGIFYLLRLFRRIAKRNRN